MSTMLNYTYTYPFESALLDNPTEPTMRWATSLDGTSDDLFFDGKLRRPALVGQCLNVLTEIVRTRFYQAGWPCLIESTTLGVPLLGRFGTSSADGELACYSHCFSEDSETVARSA